MATSGSTKIGVIASKFWAWLLQKNHLLVTVILVALLVLGTIIHFQNKKITDLQNKYQTEVNLKNALLDTADYYRNKRNEWVAEKLTIQATIKELTKMYGLLSDNQKELVDRVKEINKKNDVIAAALIQANVKIDSLLHKGEVIIDTTNKTLEFPELKNPDINYDILVGGAIPAFPTVKPTLMIKSLFLPNKSFVEFHFDKVKGNPISFSVSNSNQYVKVANIDSYAIPGINPNAVQPTGWQKTWSWIKKNGTIIVFTAGGVVAGHYLLK